MATPMVQELEQAIKTKAIALGSTLPHPNSALEHINKVAGVYGWPLVGALNLIAGNKPGQYKEHDGVLNQLAGTKGWSGVMAANRWAGII